MQSRLLTAIAGLLLLAGCNAFRGEPQAHGPQWIERSADNLVEKMGPPDRKLRLPAPSLSTVYLYLGGAQPGFAICERDYFIRGSTVIGYSEHGADPNCKRQAGNTD
ncbi:MAG TPA: hypothetical protein VG308_04605 [Stellaceae bacterium]|nr:hypothetical protein [Stellaceae bacterium]